MRMSPNNRKIPPVTFPPAFEVSELRTAITKNTATCIHLATGDFQNPEIVPQMPTAVTLRTYQSSMDARRVVPRKIRMARTFRISTISAAIPAVMPTSFWRPSGSAANSSNRFLRLTYWGDHQSSGISTIGAISSISSQVTDTILYSSSSTVDSKSHARAAIGLYLPSLASSSMSRL